MPVGFCFDSFFLLINSEKSDFRKKANGAGIWKFSGVDDNCLFLSFISGKVFLRKPSLL